MSLSEPSKKATKSFWRSVPGIMTGIASLITAVVGLLVFLGDSDNRQGVTSVPVTGKLVTQFTSQSLSLSDAFSRYKYEFSWTNTRFGVEDEAPPPYFPLQVVSINGDSATLRYQFHKGQLKLAFSDSERSVTGQWLQDDGNGELGLIFDDSLVRAEGWWNYGARTRKYNAYLRRVD